jgi:hypothetical protein
MLPEPLAFLLGAAHPIQGGHMFATADQAEEVPLFDQVPGQLAVRELLAELDLVQAEQQLVGELS